VLPERDEPPEDIGAPLLNPDVDILGSRGDVRAEDPAADPALLAGVFFRGKGVGHSQKST
jgi:hypothetical protein